VVGRVGGAKLLISAVGSQGSVKLPLSLARSTDPRLQQTAMVCFPPGGQSVHGVEVGDKLAQPTLLTAKHSSARRSPWPSMSNLHVAESCEVIAGRPLVSPEMGILKLDASSQLVSQRTSFVAGGILCQPQIVEKRKVVRAQIWRVCVSSWSRTIGRLPMR
jgi:hypothetical protein